MRLFDAMVYEITVMQMTQKSMIVVVHATRGC